MARRSLARGRAAHLGPEKRRPLVLDAALPLFIERGFGSVSMEMIAAAAGVTRPVVYDCYPNKAELFQALLEREQQRLLEHLIAALPQQPDFDDSERLLVETFTAFLSAAAASPDSWRVVFLSEHGSDPEVARRVARARALVTDRVGQLSEAVLARGGVADADRKARLVAHLVVGMGEASVRLMLTGPDQWTPQELGALLGRMTAPAERVLGES
jgi:AcrR family transcriptional regulator